MLKENIKAIRKAKGLSQEELAMKPNVVRQTVSKWEQGLSVPDADLLIAPAETLETLVCTLLGEAADGAKAIRKSRRRSDSRLPKSGENGTCCFGACFC